MIKIYEGNHQLAIEKTKERILCVCIMHMSVMCLAYVCSKCVGSCAWNPSLCQDVNYFRDCRSGLKKPFMACSMHLHKLLIAWGVFSLRGMKFYGDVHTQGFARAAQLLGKEIGPHCVSFVNSRRSEED